MTGTHTYDSKSDLSNLKYHVNLGSFWTIHYYSRNIRPHTIIKNYSAIKKNTKRQRKKKILGPLCHFQWSYDILQLFPLFYAIERFYAAQEDSWTYNTNEFLSLYCQINLRWTNLKFSLNNVLEFVPVLLRHSRFIQNIIVTCRDEINVYYYPIQKLRLLNNKETRNNVNLRA